MLMSQGGIYNVGYIAKDMLGIGGIIDALNTKVTCDITSEPPSAVLLLAGRCTQVTTRWNDDHSDHNLDARSTVVGEMPVGARKSQYNVVRLPGIYRHDMHVNVPA